VVREDADSLVIAANSESDGFVEVWELREKSQPVHKLFQPKNFRTFQDSFLAISITVSLLVASHGNSVFLIKNN